MTDIPTLPEVLAAHRLACTVESRKSMFSALCECGWEKTVHNTQKASLALHEQHRADMWDEARTIRTVEQLGKLPHGTLLLYPYTSAAGWKLNETWERRNGAWYCLAAPLNPPSQSWGIPKLPAVVLWMPEAVTDA